MLVFTILDLLVSMPTIENELYTHNTAEANRNVISSAAVCSCQSLKFDPIQQLTWFSCDMLYTLANVSIRFRVTEWGMAEKQKNVIIYLGNIYLRLVRKTEWM